MSEKISALIDNELNELDRARVLRELGRDRELAEQWSRYHIIGLAMRREQVVPDERLPERVARALESEAPADTEAPARRSAGSMFGSAGRYAIAASLAGVLLVGGLMLSLYDGGDPGMPAATTAQQAAAGSDGMRWQGVDAQSEDALNALLIEHGEFTSASGMNGLTAYTKFVAYDSR